MLLTNLFLSLHNDNNKTTNDMPYLEKELVAEIRKDIRKTFPEFKFSVTREHYSSLNIAILSGDIDFGTDYEHVNHYHVENHYEGKAKTFLKLICDFAMKDEETVSVDSDYGNIPNYYVNITIGKWDRKYQFKG